MVDYQKFKKKNYDSVLNSLLQKHSEDLLPKVSIDDYGISTSHLEIFKGYIEIESIDAKENFELRLGKFGIYISLIVCIYLLIFDPDGFGFLNSVILFIVGSLAVRFLIYIDEVNYHNKLEEKKDRLLHRYGSDKLIFFYELKKYKEYAFNKEKDVERIRKLRSRLREKTESVVLQKYDFKIKNIEGFQNIESMTGHEFEYAVNNVLNKNGIKSFVTKGSNDKGVDIWITLGTNKIPVQCKNHAKKISPKDIRDLQGVMMTNNSVKSIFVSRVGYTSGSIQQAKNSNMILLDLADVLILREQDTSSESYKYLLDRILY